MLGDQEETDKGGGRSPRREARKEADQSLARREREKCLSLDIRSCMFYYIF